MRVIHGSAPIKPDYWEPDLGADIQDIYLVVLTHVAEVDFWKQPAVGIRVEVDYINAYGSVITLEGVTDDCGGRHFNLLTVNVLEPVHLVYRGWSPVIKKPLTGEFNIKWDKERPGMYISFGVPMGP